MDAAPPVVIAVDGGGSKTDVVAVTLDGEVVAGRRGPGASPDLEGLERSLAVVDDLVRSVAAGREVVHAGVYLSGIDLPIELDRYAAALRGRGWSDTSLIVDNDLFALLRAGTVEPDAVAVVCGTGINALGVRADGRIARFAALGSISGDWGGGYGLGSEALWHAARAVDGRGPDTSLVDAVCAVLEVTDVATVIEQLHFGERDHADLARLAPAVFAAADEDDIARSLVRRQAGEIVDFVRAATIRLDLHDVAFPVVLGGGILRAGHGGMNDLIVDGIARVAPLAQPLIVREDPVVGAVSLALASVGAGEAAVRRARAEVVAAAAR